RIIGEDLFLYNRCKASLWGAGQEYLSAPRLDDVQCAFASLTGFLRAVPADSIPVLAVFDNEEVGSSTRQGASSTFLKDTLLRINAALGRNMEDYFCAISESFMISADNAHAFHPNYTDKADPVNHPVMNGGIVIKYSADQKYTTDGV
ncbi:MAG TPA: M18 family aminopeptidase, partial [Lachnospiraceae bacterium]|nr:M18 family aminopeptidase [Lachnospiraceae bacterium]